MSVKSLKQRNTVLPWWELLLLKIHHYQGVGPEDYRPVDWEVAAAIHELANGLSNRVARKALQDISGKLIGTHFRAA